MTPEEKNKIDLNAPAFGPNAQKVGEESNTNSGEEVLKEEKPDADSGEEQMVKYSRFKKFHDEAQTYKQEAERYRAEAEALRNRPERESNQDPLDEARKLWIENYGDTEATRKAWDNQVKINQAFEQRAIDRAREEARETFGSERQRETQRTQENIGHIDNELETLADYVGRPLKESEEEAILDIVDEFTPKDEDGNYAGALLPMDRAWEIYELKQGASKSKGRSSRDSIASLSGSQSQGDSSVQSEQNKNFEPRDWDAYKRRLN